MFAFLALMSGVPYSGVLPVHVIDSHSDTLLEPDGITFGQAPKHADENGCFNGLCKESQSYYM